MGRLSVDPAAHLDQSADHPLLCCHLLSAGMLVLGVFCGSASWWLLLSGGVGLLRGRLTPRILQWVNRLAGAVIAIFGIVALVL